MSVIQAKTKNWRAECPKCSNIECSEEEGVECGNCGAPALMTFGVSHNSHFSSDAARQSYRMIECSKNCGWSINNIECSKCGTTIRGDYFKGSRTWCFVATAAFNDEDHPTVEALRNWRDNTLAHSKLGRKFISKYYLIGPKLADRLDKNPIFKPVVRSILTLLSKVFK